MPGFSVVLQLVQGDQIRWPSVVTNIVGRPFRMYNAGGEIAGDGVTPDFHFHFIGVLLSTSDRQ
jgi:hypothetical protein